jgi:hypothetical protein
VEARGCAPVAPDGEVDRSLIGTATREFTCEIEKGAIRRFVEAIGDLNPLYLHEGYARARGYASVLAPPTFPVSLRPPDDPPWLRDVDRARILAGEQMFIHRRPIVAGDVLVCRLHFVAVEDKRSSIGHMEVLTQELRGNDAAGRHLVTHRRLSIVRERKSVLMNQREP